MLEKVVGLKKRGSSREDTSREKEQQVDLELVEWPVYPYGMLAVGTPTFSVFDRAADKHVFWNKDRQACLDYIARQLAGKE